MDVTRARTPEPVPVVIFLYDDYSGMPRSEADDFINQLLETSAIVYGLRDTRGPRLRFLYPQLPYGHERLCQGMAVAYLCDGLLVS